MNTLFSATVAALVLVSACNKPEPPPEAAAPAATTDTVAAAGAPIADSAAAMADTMLDSATVDTTKN